MKKVLLAMSFVLVLTMSFGYVILFDGKFNNFSSWWSIWSRNSQSLPFSPYKIRREDSAKLRFEEANKIVFQDLHLFWKGSGAVAFPELTKDGKIVSIMIKTGGSGYSDQVKVYVEGANGEDFKLDVSEVSKGRIKEVVVLQNAVWNKIPLAFYGDEELPFSGTIEKRFPSGQIIQEWQYLTGKLHGKSLRYQEKGIPVFSKDYKDGMKHGTHIYWFQDPIEPEDFVPVKNDDGEILPSLWLDLQRQAKEKFGNGYGGHESNQWVVKKYRLDGGSFHVKLLEHWVKNRKHGLFEGYDRYGNKTFTDDYNLGLRIKHKTHDKKKQ